MAAKKGIGKNVYSLGIVSFLTDVSSEMIFPILPIFLTTFLGAGKEAIGIIEGAADSITGLLDIFFGYWSDFKGSRKKFVMAGYGLSAACKVMFALATSWPIVLFARGIERLGKSIRTSPRDAIIAASSGKGSRGKAFGLHRAMDTLGAIIGPAIAYLILAALGSTEEAYRSVFYAALIPAFLAVAAIVLLVREPKAEIRKVEGKRPNFWAALRSLPSAYGRFVGISALFSLAYFSFALLIIRAGEIGVPAEQIILLYILYNISYMAFSVPIGALSDRVGRKTVIASSFLLYAAICIGFIFITEVWQAAVLFGLYGLFVSADESVNKAYVSDLSGEKKRGIALGAYNSACGAAYLPANIVFGAMWASFGAGFAFTAAALVACAASGLLFLQKKS